MKVHNSKGTKKKCEIAREKSLSPKMKQQLIYEMTSQKQQKEKDSRIVYSVY